MAGGHPFDRKKYDIADGPGKRAIAQHLSSEGKVVTDGGENYNYDLLELTDDGTPAMYHEVEVRSKWYGNPWRFSDISIPARKTRQLTGKFHPLRFWCVSPDLREAYYVDEFRVQQCCIVERWAEGKSHQFISVPTFLWTHVKLKGGPPS